MSDISPILSLVYRRGERVWFRNISRYTDYTTGYTQEVYTDNQSATMRIVETQQTEHGLSVSLPIGKAIGYGDPAEFFNDSMQIKSNDQIIRLPANYSAGTSVIFRVDRAKRVNWMNTSQLYIRVDLTETKARE